MEIVILWFWWLLTKRIEQLWSLAWKRYPNITIWTVQAMPEFEWKLKVVPVSHCYSRLWISILTASVMITWRGWVQLVMLVVCSQSPIHLISIFDWGNEPEYTAMIAPGRQRLINSSFRLFTHALPRPEGDYGRQKAPTWRIVRLRESFKPQ